MSKIISAYRFIFIRNKKISLVLGLLLLVSYYFCIPSSIFNAPVCKVLFDKDEQLLGASIAKDGQWRFPYNEDIPLKFEKCILEFEDKRFYNHFGFDLIGIGRAIQQNIKNKKVVSGASTISMQVIRLARPGKSRTLWRKLIEMVQATRLEFAYSKKEILSLYSSNAPFGGNVVGLRAATWRYYGKNPDMLSWSEAATLAVLPNSPSLIHPGKNRNFLLQKRNRLLKRLHENATIDKTTYELSLEEELPIKPLPLPRLAPHLLHTAFSKIENKNAELHSSLDLETQKNVNDLLLSHKELLNAKGIQNACVLVINVRNSNVLAYVGNMPNAGSEHHEQVDIINAPRSTGSIIKPLLNMMVLQEGLYLPQSIIPDIPTQLSGYNPENYKLTYDGIIPLDQALQRSLNIPYVRVLQNYGLEKFHFRLKQLGLSHLNKSARHYGLTLILGGAEASLWDLCNTYASASKTLSFYTENNSLYAVNNLNNISYLHKDKITENLNLQEDENSLSAAAIWHSFESMKKVIRPNSEGNWESFNSAQKIAWKTGTSFGFRDAWSIGITPDYVVGVWVGNADGEGKNGLIGIEVAAPILFDVFRTLPKSKWFDPPYDDMIKIPVCTKSGFRALENNCEVDSVFVPSNGNNAPICKYHRTLHMDASKKYQVNDSCENPLDIQNVPWFILPPVEELYYKRLNPSYKTLPPLKKGCKNENQEIEKSSMQFIYPRLTNKIYVPIELSGKTGKTIFKVAHRNEEAIIHWHLNNTYLGSTQYFHQMELNPALGKHSITLVDEEGQTMSKNFEILSNSNNE